MEKEIKKRMDDLKESIEESYSGEYIKICEEKLEFLRKLYSAMFE